MADVVSLPSRGLTPSTARSLTDSIKADAENLWKRLLHAYEQGVHSALGYASWSAYMEAEFGTKKASAYRLLDAGRVARAIEAQSPNGDSPRSEGVARALAPVLDKEGDEAVSEAYAEVVDKYGPEATAAQTASVVEARLAEDSEPGEPGPVLTKEQEQFARALRNVEAGAEYLAAVLTAKRKSEKERARRVLAIDEATRKEWNVSIKVIDNAARKLRRRVTEGRTP